MVVLLSRQGLLKNWLITFRPASGPGTATCHRRCLTSGHLKNGMVLYLMDITLSPVKCLPVPRISVMTWERGNYVLFGSRHFMFVFLDEVS